jgi:hypothetical protein
MLVEANSAQQLIELPIEAIDCLLARLQQNLLGFGSDADAEKFVGALDNLQRLSKIVAGHGEEHGLKVGAALWILRCLPFPKVTGCSVSRMVLIPATSFTIASGLFVSVMMPSLPLRDLVGCLGCWDESCAASPRRPVQRLHGLEADRYLPSFAQTAVAGGHPQSENQVACRVGPVEARQLQGRPQISWIDKIPGVTAHRLLRRFRPLDLG